jgi:hypothetical protein
MHLRHCTIVAALTLALSQNFGAAHEMNDYKSIQRPTKPLELLRNIKVAFDEGLFLEPSFRSEGNLLTFFNGAALQVLWDRPTSRMVDLVKFGDNSGASYVHIVEASVSTRFLDDTGRETPNGKLAVTVGLAIIEPGFRIDYVTDVFGQPTSIEENSAQTGKHRWPTSPKEHPLGHRIFRFVHDTPVDNRDITFATNGNGYVTFIVLKDGVK